MTSFKQPEGRRYVWRVALAMTAYLILLFATVTLFRTDPPTGPIAYAVAVLPAIPILFVFRAIGLLIVETEDEYQRMLLIKQTLLGTGLTLAVATVWQFLVNFDLAAEPQGFGIAVLWFIMWGVAAGIVRVRA